MKLQILIVIKNESKISRKSLYIDDIKTLEKASKSTLEMLLFSEFHLYVREFKMNHENKDIIENTFISTICY